MLWTLVLDALAATPVGSPYADLPFVNSSMMKAKRVEAVYPEASAEDRQVRHRCIVWVKVGPDGRPQESTVVEANPGAGCSAAYQASANAAVMQWKWKPVKIDKQKSTVHTQIVRIFPAQASDPIIDTSRAARPPPEPVKQPKRPTGMPEKKKKK